MKNMGRNAKMKRRSEIVRKIVSAIIVATLMMTLFCQDVFAEYVLSPDEKVEIVGLAEYGQTLKAVSTMHTRKQGIFHYKWFADGQLLFFVNHTNEFTVDKRCVGKKITVLVYEANVEKLELTNGISEQKNGHDIVPKGKLSLVESPTFQDVKLGETVNQMLFFNIKGGKVVDPLAPNEKATGYYAPVGDGNYTPLIGAQSERLKFVPTGDLANYFEPLVFDMNYTVGRGVLKVVSHPKMSTMYYGQKLEEAVLSNEEICNQITNSPISGTCSFVDKETVYSAGNHELEYTFIPEDLTCYGPITAKNTYVICRTVPKINVVSCPKNTVKGKTVFLDVRAENPYNKALNDVPTVKYIVFFKPKNSSDTMQISVENGKFKVPDNACVGDKITVVVSTDENENYSHTYTRMGEITVTSKYPATISGVKTDDCYYDKNTHPYQGTPVVTSENGEVVPCNNFTVNYTGDNGYNSANAPIEPGNYTVTISTNLEDYFATTSLKFKISYIDPPKFKVEGTKGRNNWYFSDVTISADGWFVSTDGINFFHNYVVNEQGESSVGLYFRDEHGHITAKQTIEVKIDKTAPTSKLCVEGMYWNSFNHDGSHVVYTSKQSEVLYNVSDTLSGIEKTEYIISSKRYNTVQELEEAVGSNWIDGYIPCKLKTNQLNIIYLKTTDNAGNVTYISSQDIMHDDIVPALEFSVPGEILTDNSIKINAKLTENGSGMDSVKIIYSESEDDINHITDVDIAQAERATITGDTVTLDLTGLKRSTRYYYALILFDKAGNSKYIYGYFTTKKSVPEVTSFPTVIGVYGTKLGNMFISSGNVKIGDEDIKGTWKINEVDRNKIPKVGTDAKYELTFYPDEGSGCLSVTAEVTPKVDKKVIWGAGKVFYKIYGEENPIFDFSINQDDLAEGDTKESLGVTFETTATKNSDVGYYDVLSSANTPTIQLELQRVS